MGKLTEKSKWLSYVLRHNPQSIGINLEENGWASVEALLNTSKVTIEELKTIVKTDNKGRYSFNDDGTKIRANQGHSIDAKMDYEERTPPEYLYHGTGHQYLENILKEGLRKQNRTHVHISNDKETAKMVGQRHGKPVILTIQSKKMTDDGFKFYISTNGVWLTEHVPKHYIIQFEGD